jgi:hypothetical protein
MKHALKTAVVIALAVVGMGLGSGIAGATEPDPYEEYSRLSQEEKGEMQQRVIDSLTEQYLADRNS